MNYLISPNKKTKKISIKIKHEYTGYFRVDKLQEMIKSCQEDKFSKKPVTNRL